MLRSGRIAPVLNRICDDTIQSALLVTTDGELLGQASSNTPSSSNFGLASDPESFGTLLADIAVDYHRLGEEFAAVDAVQRSKSHLNCLLLEMDQGLIGVSSCQGMDCLVMAVAKPDAPPGLIKARLQALADLVQESLSTLAEASS